MGRMASFSPKICEKPFLLAFMIHSSLADVLEVVKPGVCVCVGGRIVVFITGQIGFRFQK